MLYLSRQALKYHKIALALHHKVFAYIYGKKKSLELSKFSLALQPKAHENPSRQVLFSSPVGAGEVDCCIPNSFQFEMQHDHILKNLKFDLLTLFPGGRGVGGGLREKKYLLPCCCIPDSL